MSGLKECLEIVRPTDVFLMGLGVFVGSVISTGRVMLSQELIAGSVACGIFTAFAMLTNDIIDLEIDKINEPTRPIPSGRFTVKGAMDYSLVLLVFAIVVATLTRDVWWITIPPLVAFLSVFYNIFLKRIGFLGNILVSVLVGLSFIGGGLIAVGHIPTYLILFSVMAFLANLGREVHKGVVDIEGDAARGTRTIAVSYGRETAKRVAALLYCFAILLALAPIPLGLTNTYYPYMIGAICVLFFSSIYRLFRTNDKAKLRLEKNLVRIWMLFAMISFMIGGVRI